MIAVFPTFYDDELVYSLISRYYERTGYLAYIFVAQDMFENKKVRPDVEFINKLTDEAFKAVTRNQSIDDVIINHTMFSYYGKFLNLDRRKKAFAAFVSMEGNYHNLLNIPKRKTPENRYLRFCPLCVCEDRRKYGETYWHRIHQMIAIDICHTHFCELINSEVIISGKASVQLSMMGDTFSQKNIIVYFLLYFT